MLTLSLPNLGVKCMTFGTKALVLVQLYWAHLDSVGIFILTHKEIKHLIIFYFSRLTLTLLDSVGHELTLKGSDELYWARLDSIVYECQY